VVLWGLGLSYRDAALVMKGLGVPISHVEIIFNVREMGAQAMARQKKAAASIKTSVLGADETEVKLSGNGVTLGFLSDPGTGEIVGMEILASREGEELARWIVEAAKHFGAKALVSRWCQMSWSLTSPRRRKPAWNTSSAWRIGARRSPAGSTRSRAMTRRRSSCGKRSSSSTSRP